MIELIEEASSRIWAGNDDKGPVIDRNLVTISKATETLQELSALNGVMAANQNESCAA